MLLPLLFQAMVNVQMLSELEEVIQYKLVPERRESIKTMWWDRLQVIKHLSEVSGFNQFQLCLCFAYIQSLFLLLLRALDLLFYIQWNHKGLVFKRLGQFLLIDLF